MKRSYMNPRKTKIKGQTTGASIYRPDRCVSSCPVALAVLLRTCNMSNTIAQDLATEASVELAHHKEFEGDASNAAEFVLMKAVREDRVQVWRRSDIPEIIRALTALVRAA